MIDKILNLFKREITDEYIRENFVRLEEYIGKDFFQNFKFFKIVFEDSARLSYPLTRTVRHTLGFIPRDVVQLSVVADDGATITWYPDEFTRTTFKITASAACTVRAFIGRYEDAQG